MFRRKKVLEEVKFSEGVGPLETVLEIAKALAEEKNLAIARVSVLSEAPWAFLSFFLQLLSLQLEAAVWLEAALLLLVVAESL